MFGFKKYIELFVWWSTRTQCYPILLICSSPGEDSDDVETGSNEENDPEQYPEQYPEQTQLGVFGEKRPARPERLVCT